MWKQRALEDAYAELVKLAVERRSRLEESRLLWQFYWDMAKEEAGSGGRLRRAGQAGRGEEEQVQGEQACLGSPIGTWPWRAGAGSRTAGCSGSATGTWPRRRPALEDTYAEMVRLAVEVEVEVIQEEAVELSEESLEEL